MERDKKSIPVSIIIPTRGDGLLIKEVDGNEHIISPDRGHGASYARNFGSYFATKDILIFHDDDVIPQIGIEEKFVSAFLERDCVAVVASQDNTDFYENLTSIHFNNRIRYNHSLLPDYIDIIYGSCFAVLRAHFKPFNEHITGVEDVELGMRLAKKGKIYHAKDIKFYHAKYITLLQLLKNDYKRTIDRVKLFLGRKMLKQALIERRFITSPLYQLVSTIAWINPIVFLYVNLPYLRYSAKRYGWWFAFQLYTLLILDMIIVCYAIITALISNKKYA